MLIIKKCVLELSASFAFITLHKKWNFPLRISSVNVTKSAFGIYVTQGVSWEDLKTLLEILLNEMLTIRYALDTGRKLRVHKAFRKHSGRLQILNEILNWKLLFCAVLLPVKMNLGWVMENLIIIFRNCRSPMFPKIVVPKNLANFTGKHLCWSLFLIKLKAWEPATLLKRDSNTGVFLWNLPNF